jgi:hypothetical protein
MLENKRSTLTPEVYFLPPLVMPLTFFEKPIGENEEPKTSEESEEVKGRKVAKLIEKLSEKDK